MRRSEVQVVAISGFTAGAVGVDCHATILPPALSQKWFDTLVAAASAVRSNAQDFSLSPRFASRPGGRRGCLS